MWVWNDVAHDAKFTFSSNTGAKISNLKYPKLKTNNQIKNQVVNKLKSIKFSVHELRQIQMHSLTNGKNKKCEKNSHFDRTLRRALLIDIVTKQIAPQHVSRSHRDHS